MFLKRKKKKLVRKKAKQTGSLVSKAQGRRVDRTAPKGVGPWRSWGGAEKPSVNQRLAVEYEDPSTAFHHYLACTPRPAPQDLPVPVITVFQILNPLSASSIFYKIISQTGTE